MRHLKGIGVALALVTSLLVAPGPAQAKDSFKIAWSIYVGWMPWGWAADNGIVKKWADKYGITIDVVQINDYVELINQYTAGGFDGCVMTNMDALTIPAVGGVDSTALIVGDFSNGNDGIVSKTVKSVAELKGQSINLVELSVSHYLLARAPGDSRAWPSATSPWSTPPMPTSSRCSPAPRTSSTSVTWNPLLSEVAAFAGRQRAVQFLADPRRDHRPHGGQHHDAEGQSGLRQGAGRRLVRDHGADAGHGRGRGGGAHRHGARRPAPTLPGFDAQLKTTRMFWTPKEAVAFTKSPDLVQTMDHVRTFSNSKGLMGGDMDAVGIGFPGGQALGKADGIKLRFTDAYMQLAADGAL